MKISKIVRSFREAQQIRVDDRWSFSLEPNSDFGDSRFSLRMFKNGQKVTHGEIVSPVLNEESAKLWGTKFVQNYATKVRQEPGTRSAQTQTGSNDELIKQLKSLRSSAMTLSPMARAALSQDPPPELFPDEDGYLSVMGGPAAKTRVTQDYIRTFNTFFDSIPKEAFQNDRSADEQDPELERELNQLIRISQRGLPSGFFE